MPVLPFHKYIGPGNDINNGPCVDADDCIAKKHDIKYENARSPTDVRLADTEAIREFRENWLSGNWHSLIGDVGLSIKYCVETYTGVLYPKLTEYNCEILPLFNDLLKLHCVNKHRPFDRYSHPLGTHGRPEFERPENLHGVPEDLYFYILVAWYQLDHKYQRRHEYFGSSTDPAPSRIFRNDATSTKIFKKDSDAVKNCDIFNLKTWLRFFALLKIKQMTKTHHDDYNEEEFTNMFMQYD